MTSELTPSSPDPKSELVRQAQTPGQWYTTSQVAARYGYSRRNVTALIKDGRIEAFRPFRGQWRIPQSEVDRMDREKGFTSRITPIDDADSVAIKVPAAIREKVLGPEQTQPPAAEPEEDEDEGFEFRLPFGLGSRED